LNKKESFISKLTKKYFSNRKRFQDDKQENILS